MNLGRFVGKSAVSSFLILFSVGGCSEAEPEVGKVVERVVFEPGELDFGGVFISATYAKRVEVRNVGQGSVSLSLIGDSTPFEVEPTELTLASGAITEVLVRFRPMEAGKVEGKLEFQGAEKTSFILPVRGEGVERRIEATPDVVDFQDVVVGDDATAGLTIRNISDGDLVLHLGREGSHDFQVMTEPIPIASRSEVVIEVSFHPSSVGPKAARLQINPCTGCERVTVSLEGNGAAPSLNALPNLIDFGTVPPAFSDRQTWRVRNEGSSTAPLDVLRIEPDDGPFALELGASPPASIEPGEELEFAIVFDPEEVGPYEATILVGPAERATRIKVRGAGGGPYLTWDEELDFDVWPVGFEPFAVPTIRNEGELKGVRIKDMTLEGPGAGAFALGQFSSDFERESWSYRVTLQPDGPGIYEAEVVIQTNLRFQPELRTRFRAKVPTPSCELKVTHSEPVRLGLVDGSLSHPMAFDVTHEGEGDCLIWHVTFDEEADAFRFLEGAPPFNDFSITFQELKKDETWAIRAELLPLEHAANSRLIETSLGISHSQLGIRETVSVSAYPAKPFPFAVQPLVFPVTPVGKRSLDELDVEFITGLDVLQVEPKGGEFTLAGNSLLNSADRLSVSFSPAGAGLRTGVLELKHPSFVEPYLFEVAANAVSSCPDPCDWPSVSCLGWEVIERPFPESWIITALAEPSSEDLECIWLQHGHPSFSGPRSLVPSERCLWATGGMESGTTVEVIASDAQGRASTCTQSSDDLSP